MILGFSLAIRLQLRVANYQSRLWPGRLTHSIYDAAAFHSYGHPTPQKPLLHQISSSFSSSLVAKASFSSSSSSSVGVKTTTSTIAMTMKNKVDDAESMLIRRQIADQYDELSDTSEKLFGAHFHHGFCEPGATVSVNDMLHRMTEEVLRFIHLPSDGPKNVVDVGCGLGGSSTFLAKRFPGAKCIGINLSPVQVKRAQELAAAQGLSDRVSFQIADALSQPFSDGQFDLVWSLECVEHILDKPKFLSELARVAAPGATIIITSYCHRDLSPNEKSLSPKEKKQLAKLCETFNTRSPISTSDYVNIMQSLNLQDIRTADWSKNVIPFWIAMRGSLLSWRGMTSIIFSGWTAIKGMLITPALMLKGYKNGLIKFSVITCRKPYSSK